MFNVGASELVVILVVALIVLGPQRLPELARGLGKFLREFRKHTDEVRSVVEREFYRMDQEPEPTAQKPVALPPPIEIRPNPDSIPIPEAPLSVVAPTLDEGSVASRATGTETVVTPVSAVYVPDDEEHRQLAALEKPQKPAPALDDVDPGKRPQQG